MLVKGESCRCLVHGGEDEMGSPSKKRGKGGRRPRLTKEVEVRICGALRTGGGKGLAAVSAGVSESAFYEWLKIGEEADAKQAGGERLTQRELQCRDLFLAVARAVAEYGEDLRRLVLDVAAHGLERRATLSRREVFDPQGEKIWLEAEEFQKIEKPNLHALMAIREEYERESAPRSRPLDDEHGDEFVRVGEMERRLAARIRERPLRICDDDEEAEFTRPASVPADEDDDYDMYGPWLRPTSDFMTHIDEIQPEVNGESGGPDPD
jgi:hypothetical protein